MHPSIQIGHLLLPSFSLALLSAVFVLIGISAIRGKSCGLGAGVVMGAVLAGVAGFGGAEQLFHSSLQRHVAGSEILGDILAAALAIVVWAAFRRIRLLRLADCLAPPLALFSAIVGIGSFMAGCDFGKSTGHGWGVTYSNGLALAWYGTPLGTSLHPTQLYESALAAFIFVLLVLLQRRLRREGMLFSALVALYAVGHFFIEFLRGEVDHGFSGPLSVSQWLCMMVFAVFLLPVVRGLRSFRRRVARPEVFIHR